MWSADCCLDKGLVRRVQCEGWWELQVLQKDSCGSRGTLSLCFQE